MPALGFQVQERNGDLVVTLGDCASASARRPYIALTCYRDDSRIDDWLRRWAHQSGSPCLGKQGIFLDSLFSSDFLRRSTFLMSSSAGRFSGFMPL